MKTVTPPKPKRIWACQECGHTQSKWGGQCPQCQQWNTLHEEPLFRSVASKAAVTALRLQDIQQESVPRLFTGIQEIDRLLGGGLVRGSLILIGGDPGIGKSTLSLQISEALASQELKVLYVCGEESLHQTSMRATRLGVSSDSLLLLSETSLELIQQQINELCPDVLIVDSIQIVYKEEVQAAPGSVSQVRDCATTLMHLAKSRNLTTFLIGHVTKTGEIAGPRVLEHIVDTVLYFEGEKQHQYRILRSIKNRFGSTDEIAVFQMGPAGLIEVHNPSQIFLEERVKGHAGSVVVPTLEGSRPILVEMQALVTDSCYTTPSRRCAGFDPNRLALLIAVLEKRVGYLMHHRDIFVSITGGLKLGEPALDLAVMVAMGSSLTNRKVDPETIVVGEVGLAGEVRTVSRIEARIREALHLGFTRCVVPARHKKEIKESIEIIGVEYVEEALQALLH